MIEYSAVVTFSAVVSVPAGAPMRSLHRCEELLPDLERLRPLRVIRRSPECCDVSPALRAMRSSFPGNMPMEWYRK